MSHVEHEVQHPGNRDTSRLRWTLGLVLLYMGAEVVGGVVSGSLALLADAGHMLSDAVSLSLALFAMWIARRPPNDKRTFGYHRAEILAALTNGVALVLISIWIFWEAWQRFQDPPEVLGPLMMGVAVGGLVVNGIGLMLLHSGRDQSLNERGAWLHVLADAAGSVGAIGAGVLVWWRGWNLADPIASVLIGALVLGSSWRLLRESVGVLMQGTPRQLELDDIASAIAAVEGVESVHDLHVWTVTTGLESLSAHVGVGEERERSKVLSEVRKRIHDRFGIDHCTIQLESEEFEERDSPV